MVWVGRDLEDHIVKPLCHQLQTVELTTFCTTCLTAETISAMWFHHKKHLFVKNYLSHLSSILIAQTSKATKQFTNQTPKTMRFPY